MSQNAVAQIRKLLGVDNAEKPRVMTVAERNDNVTVLIDHTGNSIKIETTFNSKARDRVIVSGGNILGKAEQPSVTVWIN